MAQVYFPRQLVAIISGLPKQTEIEAGSVKELIAAVDARWPGVQMCLCATGKLLREHIKIFVDGRQSTLEMPVRPDSTVRIITAVSGG
jgi:sulfur-carrier protein